MDTRRLRPLAFLAALAFTATLAVACDETVGSSGISDTSTSTPTSSAPAPALPEPVGTPTAGVTDGGSASSPPSAGAPPSSMPPVAPTLPAPPSTTPTPLPTSTTAPISGSPVTEPGRTLKLAPIEKVDVIATKSLPAQYMLVVTSGLPGGCAKYAGATVEIKDTQIIVTVFNSMPTAPTDCTAIYGTTTHGVSIGALTPGVAYKVVVNDKSMALLAQ